LNRFTAYAPAPLQVALQGDLGAGKTTFTRVLGKALGITDRVTSPSYIGVNGYMLPNGTPFVHADFYRGEAQGAEGVLDEIETLIPRHQPAWIIAEWTSFAPYFEAESDVMIEIASPSLHADECRSYTLTPLSTKGHALVDALKGDAS
jgi:tRNA threonylcarbamoyl adenosine modification protein YjeE